MERSAGPFAASLAAFAALLATALPAQAPAAALPPDFDAYIAAVQEKFAIPGLSIAVVQDGRTALARGYGVRRLGEPAPVDERTRFGIASNTKVFTAAAIGLLVEQGKLQWDGRVQDWLPAFQLSDPFVSRELTVRDLLVHRSGLGLGAGDLLWWPQTDYDRKEILRRLRNVPLATSFRSAYAYDNVLYLVAGELIEAVSGRTWEQFVQQELLAKIGMAHSTVDWREDAAAPLAGTHARVGGAVAAVPPMTSTNTDPAGGIHACAEDMAKWLHVLLGNGALPDGGRVFSARTARELTTLVTPIPIRDPDPVFGDLRPNFNGYALGLGVRDYRGRKVITHTGGLPGYVSRVLFVPEARFGIAVLTNQESLRGIDAIVFHALDHALGAGGMDWFQLFAAAEADAEKEVAAGDAKADAARSKDSAPSLPLERYAGTYRDAWYGDVVVELRDGRLAIAFAHTPLLHGALEHWQHDTFVARWTDRTLRADAYVTFALRPDGGIDQVKMLPASPDVDFSFDYAHLLLKPLPAPPPKPVAKPKQ
jgi:CubicO group peptidase (beta-lactamase class C family)